MAVTTTGCCASGRRFNINTLLMFEWFIEMFIYNRFLFLLCKFQSVKQSKFLRQCNKAAELRYFSIWAAKNFDCSIFLAISCCSLSQSINYVWSQSPRTTYNLKMSYCRSSIQSVLWKQIVLDTTLKTWKETNYLYQITFNTFINKTYFSYITFYSF